MDADERQIELATLQIKLEKANSHEEGLMVAKTMGARRADCLQLVEAKAAVLSNSCESLADAIRRDAYIAYSTVYDETKKRVFQDYNDFLRRANEPVVISARELLLTVATEAFQESLTSLPEVNYVQKVEKHLKAEDAKVAKETAKVAKTKKKTTKKTTKKKTTKQVTKKITN